MRRIPNWLNWFFLLGALLQAAALSFPFNPPSFFGYSVLYGQPIWWLQWVASALFFVSIVKSQTVKQSFWKACGYWLVVFVLSLDWLYTTMHVYGGMNAILTVVIIVIFSFFLSLFYALFAVIYHWIFVSYHGLKWLRPLGFAALMTLAELARGTWFTGFGWANPAYSQLNGPLASYAPWLGVYGIDFLLLFISAQLICIVIDSKRIFSSFIATTTTLLAVFIVVLGVWRPLNLFQFSKPMGVTLSVTLLQGNIDQADKFGTSGILTALQWYQEKLFENQSDIVIAPETAIPLLPDDLPPSYWQEIRGYFSQHEQAALIGTPWGSLTGGYENAILGLKPSLAQPYLYFKHHLVPFGEYVPPLFSWVVELMKIPLGNFRAGGLVQPLFMWKSQKISPIICFEILFSEELAARFREESSAPSIFVSTSNLAWFGDSRALWQHLAIARMRALEFQRPILQANNTGITAIIAANGEVIKEIAHSRRGELTGQVQGMMGSTFYASWVARFGLWPFWLVFSLIVSIFTLVSRFKISTKNRDE